MTMQSPVSGVMTAPASRTAEVNTKIAAALSTINAIESLIQTLCQQLEAATSSGAGGLFAASSLYHVMVGTQQDGKLLQGNLGALRGDLEKVERISALVAQLEAPPPALTFADDANDPNATHALFGTVVQHPSAPINPTDAPQAAPDTPTTLLPVVDDAAAPEPAANEPAA